MGQSRLGYIGRRLIWAAVTVWGITIINFVLIYAVPVNPAQVIAGIHAPHQTVLNIERDLGLTEPIWVQYGLFLWRLLHLNLGYSYMTHRPVLAMIEQALPNTLRLGVAALCVELLIGVTLGYLAAFHSPGVLDRLLTVLSLVGMSVPNYWLGTMFIYLFAYLVPIFPLYGQGWGNVILPAVTIGITGAPYYMRLLRTAILQIRHANYVRTARAKGVPERSIAMRHVTRNALMPIVTLAGLDLAGLLSGVVIIETVFGWPGIGLMSYQAVQNLDTPTIMGTVILASLLIVIFNLVVDLLYAFLDPRIQYA
jgi:ABC-type dipeptide/oligopeptide/nickel transport system permease component